MGVMPFLVKKMLNTQRGAGRCAHKSPIMKWANVLKILKQNSLRPKATSHNKGNWYTDADGFLECSPSGGSLYYKAPPPEDNSGFLGPPSYIFMGKCLFKYLPIFLLDCFLLLIGRSYIF